jgi:hypothetical protein
MFRHWPKYARKGSSYLLFTSIRFSKICINDNLFQNIILLKAPVAFMSSINNNQKYDEEKVTVANMIKYWHEVFEKERIMEPKQSIEYIIAHVLGISRVNNRVFNNIFL